MIASCNSIIYTTSLPLNYFNKTLVLLKPHIQNVRFKN